jgi:hypothetical protein
MGAFVAIAVALKKRKGASEVPIEEFWNHGEEIYVH